MNYIDSTHPTATVETRETIPPVRKQSTPANRVIILGAGRNLRGDIPSAITQTGPRGRVLDWILSAFSLLEHREVSMVTGYRADTLLPWSKKVNLLHNPQWETTGPSRSLRLSDLSSRKATWVTYSDIVFRPCVVTALEAEDTDIAIAVDRNWIHRYNGRGRNEINSAEKIICDGNTLTDIGPHIPTSEAHAEFAGVLRLSPRAASMLDTLFRNELIPDTADIPTVIRILRENVNTVHIVEVDGDWAELNAPQDLARFVLGTKAESLERLRPLLRTGVIGQQVSFPRSAWDNDNSAVIHRVDEVFHDSRVIVRSSALSEDTWHHSSAGAYESVLDVEVNPDSLSNAIETVLNSYAGDDPQDHVLVQKMLTDIAASGVVMTRTPANGAPWYIINYDDTTQRTDTVTSGTGSHLRTAYLHRDAIENATLPASLGTLATVIREIEELVGHDALDIEFAITQDQTVHILQVRPIAISHLDQPINDEKIRAGLHDATQFFRELQSPTPSLVGNRTQLSIMSDWNPAEIIGTKPTRLAFSLYRHLITDETWARQRAEYGYRDVRPCNLLVDILGHPYIDVRATFNSFIPADLPDSLAEKLLNHYIDQLRQRPELHDKVEFDILLTCMTFDFNKKARPLQNAGLREADCILLQKALTGITWRGIARIPRDLAALKQADLRYKRAISCDASPLQKAFFLLEDARLHSIPAFAHLARGAFVAMSLLKSLVSRKILSQEQLNEYLASLRTVSSDMQADAWSVQNGQMEWQSFVTKYGHLRPGTYDITSPRYDSNPDLYLRPVVNSATPVDTSPETGWNTKTRNTIEEELRDLGIDIDCNAFENFLRQAIEGREFSKFVFTRNLSAAMEILATWADQFDISRDDLAHVRIEELMTLRSGNSSSPGEQLRQMIRNGREAAYVTQAVCLPGQIIHENDFLCFQQMEAQPNYVTQKQVQGQLVCITGKTSPSIELDGRIVMTPNADPGFDWLFSRPIAGLITMYGGANSHMAIRSAEFRLPAAIGIGEQLYEQLAQADIIDLDCESQKIRVIR